MISSAPRHKRLARLHDTVDRVAPAGGGGPTPAAAAQALVARWVAASRELYGRIEQLYLLEFLMFGRMGVRLVRQTAFAPQAGAYEIESLMITVGPSVVSLSPSLKTETQLGVLTLRGPSSDREVALLCDLRASDPCWMIDAKETGLRRLISSYLPEKLVGLNEHLFKDALNDVLAGPQPLFTYGRQDLRDKVGHLLDFITSDELRASLALTAASGVEQFQARVLAPRQRRIGAQGDRAFGGRLLLSGAGEPDADPKGGRDGPA